MTALPFEYEGRFTCPVTDCPRHQQGYATLHEKKQHVREAHATTRKAKR